MSNYRRRRSFGGGVLDTPIREPTEYEFTILRKIGKIPEPQTFSEWRAASVEEQRQEKIPELMSAMGLGPGNNYRHLALALAERFVPGFQTSRNPPRSPGRPEKWDRWRYLELFLAVEQTRLKHGLPYDRNPSRLLDLHLGITSVTSEAHRLRLREAKNHATLRNHYTRARNPRREPLLTGYGSVDEAQRAHRRAYMTSLLADISGRE